MPITSDRAYRQVLSTALALRSPGIEDLVSNSNALYNVLKRKGRMKSFTGPEIRQTLQIDKQQAQWYKGYDFLANPPIELFNDAVFTPKSVVVPVSLTGQEMRANQGATQIHDIMESYMEAAEMALVDNFDAALFSDGTGDGGKQIIGLGGAVPIVTNAGIYGGIDRSLYPLWRTSTFDAHTAFPDIGTQVNSVTIRPMLSRILSQRSRGNRAADLLIMSQEHYWAYDAATVAIQRITNESTLGKLGFTALEYVGGGTRAEIVLASGLNSNMPSNTTFGLETRSMWLRYREGYNFASLFDGDGQMPINQDAIAQFIGWEGELVLSNPLFTFRLYDSVPAS